MLDQYWLQDVWMTTVPMMEPMTLRSRTSNAAATFTDYAIPRAKRRPLRLQERQLGGGLLSDDTMLIEVWLDALTAAGAPVPKSGDVWVDAAGDSWVIIPDGVDQGLMDQRYNTHCQRQIAGG